MTGKFKSARNFLLKFSHDESATTAIEYAVIAGGIALAIVVSVNDVGSTVDGLFASVQGSF